MCMHLQVAAEPFKQNEVLIVLSNVLLVEPCPQGIGGASAVGYHNDCRAEGALSILAPENIVENETVLK